MPIHHIALCKGRSQARNSSRCILQLEGGKGKALQRDVVQALYVHASDASEGGATLRTRVYDDLGKLPWPQDVDGRALRNRFAATFPDGVPEAVRPGGTLLCADPAQLYIAGLQGGDV